MLKEKTDKTAKRAKKAQKADIKKIKTKDLILNTAYSLLVKKGYANVFTRDIAEGAGVALSQLNYYFKTKEKLFISIIEVVIRKIVSELKVRMEVGRNRRENFLQFVEYFKDLTHNDPGVIKIIHDFTSQAIWVKPLKIHIYAMFRELNLIIQKYIIKTDISQETFKGCPTDFVAEIVIFGILGLSLHALLGEQDMHMLKIEQIANVLFDEDTPVAVI